jgi:hypothetical protein
MPTRRVVAAVACYALIGVAALTQVLCETEYFWFLWMTPALAILTYSDQLPSLRPEPALGSAQNGAYQ